MEIKHIIQKEFKPLEMDHLYLNHKTIKLCNKINHFMFATKCL